MILKEAKREHCDLLYNWANDKEVRENSFSKEKINYEDHIRWFYNKLQSKGLYLFIAYLENIPIGQVRLDFEDNSGIISYSISKEFRSKGYGKSLIVLLESKLKEKDISFDKLIAYVKPDNISSQKVFEKLGYNKIASQNKIMYYKSL